jgi:hypothetical protein
MTWASLKVFLRALNRENGSVPIGENGKAGVLQVFPATASKGSFKVQCDDQTGDTAVILKPAAMGQATTLSIPDPGAASASVVLTAGNQSIAGTKTFTGSIVRAAQQIQITAGAKIGATAGWTTMPIADDLNSLARCPAEQTAATLVVPITGLKIGSTITGFSLCGQIESAGGHATIIAALRAQTAVAAGCTDAEIGAMAAALDVTADTVISASNAAKTGLTEVVAVGKSYYLLITSTTAASTDIDLLSAIITVTEA